VPSRFGRLPYASRPLVRRHAGCAAAGHSANDGHNGSRIRSRRGACAPRHAPPQLPRALEGVITQDEYAAYVKFQQGLRDLPEIKDLTTQIRQKMSEMIELQKKSQAAQQKAIESNPDIKAIVDKIKKGKPKPPTAAPAPAAVAPPAAVTPAAPPTPATK